MLNPINCMEGWIGVERDGCDRSNGLGGKQGSSPSFHGAFLTNRAQNMPLQVNLQDVIMHSTGCPEFLQDPMYSYRIQPREKG